MAEGELLGRSVLELVVDPTGLERGLTAAQAKTRAATARMETDVGRRMTHIGDQMGRVGSRMTHSLTLPIVGVGAAAIKMAADFDAAMERVHTQSGATQKEVNALRGQVLDLAKSMAQSPTELAEALYRLEGAGFRGAKAMDALRASAKLAAVGNADVEDTAKTLTQVMKPAIKGTGDFATVVGKVNATVGAGDMRLQQLVDALGTGVVTSAKQAGLSFQDVTGALAVFGDETNNVSGWSAQLATAFHYLYAPTQKAETAMESMGLSGARLAKDLSGPNGLVTALRDLRSHLEELPGGIKGVQARQTLSAIFPGGRGRVMTVLLNQTDLLEQKMNQIQHTSGNFADSVAKTQKTMAYRIHAAWSTIQADLIDVGEAIGPDVLKIGETVANDVDKLANAFTGLPKPLQQMILKGGLLLAATGPALSIVGALTRNIGSLTTLVKSGSLSKALGVAGKGTAAARGLNTVATMEVGEMVVRSMVGGGGPGGVVAPGGKGGGAAGRTAGELAGEAGGAAAAGTAARSIGNRVGGALKGALRKGVKGAGGAIAVDVASEMAAGFTHGRAHDEIKSAARGATAGAFGFAFGPEVGIPSTLIGALGTMKPLGHASPTERALGAQRARDFPSVKMAGGEMAAEVTRYRQLTREIQHYQKVLSDPKATDAAKQEAQTREAILTREQHDLAASAEAAHGWNLATIKATTSSAEEYKALGTAAQLSTRQLLASVNRAAAGAGPDLQRVRKGFADLADTAGGDIKQLNRVVDNNLKAVQDSMGQHSRKGQQLVATNFELAVRAVSSAMHDGKLSTQDGMGEIERLIRVSSDSSAAVTQRNFTRAKDAIAQAIKAGTISVRKGTQEITSLTVQEALKFGVHLTNADLKSHGASQPNEIGHRAGGGFIGMPGEAGRDEVPIMVGRGEAVLNRHQQAPVDMALRSTFGVGLDGLFSTVTRPHYFARGGLVGGLPGFATGGRLQLPASFSPTHQTAGLPGYPAIDDFASPGTVVLSPVDGTVARFSGRPPSAGAYEGAGGPFGWSMYINGTNGRSYYLTHMGSRSVRVGEHVTRGEPIGTVGDYPGGTPDHIHEGVHGGLTGISGGGGMVMTPPHLKRVLMQQGLGYLTPIGQAALDTARGAALRFLNNQAPSGAGFPGLGAFTGGGSSSANQALGHRMMLAAGWPESQWPALRALWIGESGWDANSVNQSSGAYGIPQALGHGHVFDLGDAPAQIRWGLNYIRSTYGSPQAAYSAWLSRNPHWYARGGFVGGRRGFARGGFAGFGPNIPGTHAWSGPRYAKQARRGRKPRTHKGRLSKALTLKTAGFPGKAYNWLGALMSDGPFSIEAMVEAEGNRSTVYDRSEETFVVQPPDTVDAAGNPVTPPPFLDQAAVKRRTGELSTLLGMEQGILGAVNQASHTDQRVANEVARAKARAEKRKARLRQQAWTVMMRIRGLAKSIQMEQKRLKQAQDKLDRDQRQLQREQGKKHKSRATIKRLKGLIDTDHAAIKASRDRIRGLQAQMPPLHKAELALSGEKDRIGSGGAIGQQNTAIDTMNTALADTDEWRKSLTGLSGTGGTKFDVQGVIYDLKQQLGQLSPDALAQALREAQGPPIGAPSASDVVGGESEQDQQIQELLKQQLQRSQQALAVSQAQYKVLSQLPPFGGSFALGGVVPGPAGAARTVIAHGGETIGNPGPQEIQVIVQDGAVDPDKIRVIAHGAAVQVTNRIGSSYNLRRQTPTAR